MFRLLFLVVLGAGVFSFLAFQKGGYVPGVILAVVAVAPLVWLIASARRRKANGGSPAPYSPTAKRAIGAAALVLVLGVAYSAYWMFWVPKAATKELTATYQLRDLCDSTPTFYRDAAPFDGAAPHPVVVFAKGDDVGLDEVRVDYSAPAQWQPRDAKTVQLVACLDEVESGPKLADCSFSDGSLPLYQGRFTGTLYEAATGKKVASISANGAGTPKCPGAALTQSDNPRLHSVPDLAGLRAAIGDRVER
ncbi:hypothetical protein [Tsukamurella pseudospumae]|uniref:Uncharacterized protein n=1 Tax=Tsukamurella pseudospumae TaxID=239498 RepID=A0A137ZTT3_9ACTN|nr:hypothetical protein [Tsukamurella pseudospumae]KXP01588.1 hypothetical protein AXK61_01950 [Tsukamurella pseudospumae]